MSDLDESMSGLNLDNTSKRDVDCIHITATYDEGEDWDNWEVKKNFKSGLTADDGELHDLSNVMSRESASGFPCSSFSFLGGSLGEEELQEFLKTFGKRMKKLVLDVFDDYVDEDEGKFGPPIQRFKALLAEQAPNLQYLRLDKLPERWESPPGSSWKYSQKKGKQKDPNRLFPQLTRFPNLKILELPEKAPEWLVNEMVRVCPNLEEFIRF